MRVQLNIVIDVPDEQVTELGELAAAQPSVGLTFVNVPARWALKWGKLVGAQQVHA